ncbi:DUF475 domain-containing protein [Candidatus Saccharibacteria bacterium TM7i]|nr:DUF475 domain-containing protein [Candidatus Saccharibacteria bacterium TM7i]
MQLLSFFKWTLLATAASLIAAYFYGGWAALATCIILGILEVSLSFDNAVLNASILRKMSPFWQKMFLTIGIIIAVFGMRLVFPLLIVAIAAQLNPVEAVQLALAKGDPHTPGTYGYILAAAHPYIAAFGGMFLLLLFLDFIFEDRDIKWLQRLEKPLAKIGRLKTVSVLLALGGLVAATATLPADVQLPALTAGIFGVMLYIFIKGLGDVFQKYSESKMGNMTLAVGKAGFFMFLYLEVLDATLSFDGAIGAFAITPDPIIIGLGLGIIGAMAVRSLTVYMVRKGTLDEFVHLEHGAHWAIGALAVILLVSITVHVNEIITGLVGLVFIGAAFWTSILYRRKHSVK